MGGLLSWLFYPFLAEHKTESSVLSNPFSTVRSGSSKKSTFNWFYPAIASGLLTLGGTAWWFRDQIAELFGFDDFTDLTGADEYLSKRTFRATKKVSRKVTKAARQNPFVIMVVFAVILVAIISTVCVYLRLYGEKSEEEQQYDIENQHGRP